jgi:hypothetical protein
MIKVFVSSFDTVSSASGLSRWAAACPSVLLLLLLLLGLLLVRTPANMHGGCNWLVGVLLLLLLLLSLAPFLCWKDPDFLACPISLVTPRAIPHPRIWRVRQPIRALEAST